MLSNKILEYPYYVYFVLMKHIIGTSYKKLTQHLPKLYKYFLDIDFIRYSSIFLYFTVQIVGSLLLIIISTEKIKEKNIYLMKKNPRLIHTYFKE